MRHIIWRKSLRKKKISVASRLLGQHASHHSQFTLAASLVASTRFNAAWRQGPSNLIRLRWVFIYLFLRRDSIAEWNQTKSIRKYLEPGPDCLKFQLDLHNVNQLLTPIARGLETLEGQNTTCSDVFHVYIGIAVNFVAMFSDRGKFLSCSTFIIAPSS